MTDDLHAQAVALLTRRLPEGLPHPGDPSQLLTFPGMQFRNMPEELREAVLSMSGLLCEAIVTCIEQELDAVLVRRRPPPGLGEQ